MANNETGILESGPGPASGHAFSPKATEIFHCEAAGAKLPLPGLKRKFGTDGESSGPRPKLACSSGASLISPPLFKPRPNLAMVPGYPHEAGPTASGHNNEHAAPGNQEDEWKNIKVVSCS